MAIVQAFEIDHFNSIFSTSCAARNREWHFLLYHGLGFQRGSERFKQHGCQLAAEACCIYALLEFLQQNLPCCSAIVFHLPAYSFFRLPFEKEGGKLQPRPKNCSWLWFITSSPDILHSATSSSPISPFGTPRQWFRHVLLSPILVQAPQSTQCTRSENVRRPAQDTHVTPLEAVSSMSSWNPAGRWVRQHEGPPPIYIGKRHIETCGKWHGHSRLFGHNLLNFNFLLFLVSF